MKVKRMGITEILRRIWLFSANKIKSSVSFSNQPTQLIVELNSSLQHIIVTLMRNLKNMSHKSSQKYLRSVTHIFSTFVINAQLAICSATCVSFNESDPKSGIPFGNRCKSKIFLGSI